MKGLKIIGEYIFEYLVITILLVLSFILIIPFIPVYTGTIAYFRRVAGERMIKDIFITIAKEFKIIVKLTIFELIFIYFAALNIYYINTNPEAMNTVFLFVSYIALVIGIVILINSPIILLNMNVNFKQLIYNSIALILGGLKNFVLAIFIVIGYLVICSMVPVIYVLGIYFIPLCIAPLTYQSFLKLKAKALNTTVYELTKQEKEDDYIDEYGNVKSE